MVRVFTIGLMGVVEPDSATLLNGSQHCKGCANRPGPPSSLRRHVTYGFDHVAAVLDRGYFGVAIDDSSRSIDHKGPAFSGDIAEEGHLLIIHLGHNLFGFASYRHAKGLGDLTIGIREQCEVQTVKLLERLVVFYRVSADADDLDIEFAQFRSGIAVTACLFGASPGHVRWIEVDDYGFFADVLITLPIPSGIIQGCEEWCR